VDTPIRIASALAQLERQRGGRLGVAICNTASGAEAMHRGDERFPMCSTFKFLLVAQALSRVDAGRERLDRRIVFERSELVPWSPVTEKHPGESGMRIEELCAAAMMLSDNTAANLLLAQYGGPSGLTAFARTLGDPMSRLDRIEPSLNEARPGDLRDTTTPTAMRGNLHALLVGRALSASSRKLLTEWMFASTTGAKRLRAGVPGNWKVGDKTGTSGNGISNDIGILVPPHGVPLLVTVYFEAAPGMSQDDANGVIAEAGRISTRLVAAR